MESKPNKNSHEINPFPAIRHRQKRFPTECKICGGSALYSSYGTVVCDACRKFFRRNANKNQDIRPCVYGGHCEINIHNRHLCSSCRLAKCFQSGMQVETFRSPRTTNQQLPTLSLLQSDQSTLSIDQWNHLSNLIHCYDEYSGFSLIQRFIEQQNRLLPKMRFKLSSMDEHFRVLSVGIQSLYEKNADFVSLCPHDRSILLHQTMEYVTSLGNCFIMRHTRVFENRTFCQSIEANYGSAPLNNVIRAVNQVDCDVTFVKVVLALLIFSKCDFIDYTNMPRIKFTNIRAVLHFQNMYTELIWRYLLYKYGHKQAVICFSNLVRAVFLLNNAFIELNEVKTFTNMMNSLITQTEKTVISN